MNTEQLEEIVTLIESAYNHKNDQFRKQQDALLEMKKRSMDWKAYVMSLFQIIYFSERINNDTLHRVIHDNSEFIYKRGNFSAITTDELIYLYAANVCCLVNRNFPGKIKQALATCLEKLSKIEDDHKGKLRYFV
jgi:hypothetical protein